MKKWISVLPIAVLILSCHTNSGVGNPTGADTLGLLMNTDSNAAENLVANDQTFDQQLSPYGRWTSLGSYRHVWIPNEGRSFRPYCSHGHWVYSDAGWVWNSDYKWGWAPFHYGRWLYDDNEGWAWVPGYEWAPAWVTWGRCNDYYGWAPLAPGISVSVAFNSWHAPREYWNFVPEREFVREREYGNVVNIYSDPVVVNTIYDRVAIINNRPERNIYRTYNSAVIYNAGPRVTEVERVTHQRITPVVLRESANPVERVSNRQMNIYSPAIHNYVQRNRNNDRNFNQQNNRNVVVNQPMHNVQAQPNNQRNFVQQNRNGRQIIQQQDNHAAFNPANRSNPRNNAPVTAPVRMNARNFVTHNVPANRNWNNGGRHDIAPVNRINNASAPTRNQVNRPAPNHFAPQRQQHVQNFVRPQMTPRQNNRPQMQQHFERPQQVQHQAPQMHQMQNRPQMAPHQNFQRSAPQNHPAPQMNRAPQNHPAPPQNNNHGSKHH